MTQVRAASSGPVWACAVVLALLSSTCAFADSLNLRLAGEWPFDGHTCSVPVQSRNVWFCGSGGGVLILDISDPSRPLLVSDRLRTGGIIRAMAYDSLSQRLFLAGEKVNFEVWDVSSLSNPSRLGACRSPVSAAAMALLGDCAYVADRDSGLRIISVANPASPYQAGRYDTPGNAQGVAAVGQYAYVADGAAVRVIDISNSASPFEVSHLDSAVSLAVSIGLRGRYAFISNGYRGLLSIDVSDPAHPRAVGSCATRGFVYNMALCDSYAFIAEDFFDSEIVSVSDPEHPIVVSATGVSALSMSAYGHCAVVAGTGPHLFDASGPSLPREIGTYDTPLLNGTCAISDQYAYVGSNTGLRVIDVSDLQYPHEVGSCAAGSDDIAISGRYLYAPCNFGFGVIDIQDPANPRQVGGCNFNDVMEHVASAGSIACVGAQNSVPLFDVSDPSNPSVVGVFDSVIDHCHGVVVRNSLAYLAELRVALRILDISDPAHPHQIGCLPADFYATDIALSWPYAFIPYGGFSDSGLSIVDVSDPANPREVGRYRDTHRMDYITLDGTTAYVLGWFAGLRVLDITDPIRPRQIGYYDDVGFCGQQMIVPRGRYVFVPTSASGLHIFENLLYGVAEDEGSSSVPKVASVEPNPVTGQSIALSFDLTEPGEVAFRVYDAVGRLAAPPHSGHFGRGHHVVRLPVVGLAAGAYFVRTSIPTDRNGQKVIVRR